MRPLIAALVCGPLLWAQTPVPPSAPVPPPVHWTGDQEDPLLIALVMEALQNHPSLARGQGRVAAERERIPQATALADPTLSVGLQNEGFRKLTVGEMEGSAYQLMLTQPLPWPGKRALRGEVAKVGVELAETEVRRAATTLTADVKRAYVGLLLVRGQVDLLNTQEAFWQKAAELTRVRYEVGQGTQADLLRAQVELTRLQQNRLALAAEERAFLATLNGLLVRPQDSLLPTTRRLEDLPILVLPAQTWIDRAAMDCCETQDAALLLKQAELGLTLAKRERYPDLAVSAGVMPRGSLDPMWQVGVSVSLPIWSGRKQKRAIAEQEWRRKAGEAEVRTVRALLTQRIHERQAQLEAAVATLKVYREGLLVQGEASFQASLAQYEAGRGSFLAVLEALTAWAADRGAYLQTHAQAQALAIAQEEFNLAGTPPIAASGLRAASMAMGGSPGGMPTASRPSATSAQGEAGGTMSPM